MRAAHARAAEKEARPSIGRASSERHVVADGQKSEPELTRGSFHGRQHAFHEAMSVIFRLGRVHVVSWAGVQPPGLCL